MLQIVPTARNELARISQASLPPSGLDLQLGNLIPLHRPPLPLAVPMHRRIRLALDELVDERELESFASDELEVVQERLAGSGIEER